MDQKTCTKCRLTLPATPEHFYRNAGGKFGLTPRCKPCVNQDNAEQAKKRLLANPEAERARASARSKRHYDRNLELSRQRGRESAARARADPSKGQSIKARKRAGGAGLTPVEVQFIRDAQNNQCAICHAPEPNDLDHCHKTGKVRFLLCNHCNRGLGAFKDRPDLMRRAADLLESIS